MRKYIYIIYALCFFDGVQAQVLWSEDFDSYITGTFSMGQGGWTGGLTNSEIRVISESGRGNVLAWGLITGNAIATQNDLRQYNLTNLWNTRTPGNNVLKLEYDLYTEDFPVAGLENIYTSGGVFYKTIKGSSGLPIDVICDIRPSGSVIRSGGGYYSKDYDHTWIKVESYLDYDAANDIIYQFDYIPSLNYLAINTGSGGGGEFLPDFLRINFNAYKITHSGALVKYDNFKLSALPTRPSYLSTSEFVASKFNIFPNPVTDVVTITNSENIGIEQIEVFDISGKTIKSLNYNNENEVQLHLGDFASGTYLLHIQTNEGMAVKKVVKK